MAKEFATILTVTLISIFAWIGASRMAPKGLTHASFIGKAETVESISPELQTDILGRL